jgi:hypothetical protein
MEAFMTCGVGPQGTAMMPVISAATAPAPAVAPVDAAMGPRSVVIVQALDDFTVAGSASARMSTLAVATPCQQAYSSTYVSCLTAAKPQLHAMFQHILLCLVQPAAIRYWQHQLLNWASDNMLHVQHLQ